MKTLRRRKVSVTVRMLGLMNTEDPRIVANEERKGTCSALAVVSRSRSPEVSNAFVQIRSVTRTKMGSSYKFALSTPPPPKKKSRVALKICTQITMVKNRKNYQEEVTDPQLL